MLSSPVFAKQNSRRPASLAPVALRPLHFRQREKKCIRRQDFPPFFSYSYALFHFPYPVTPLLASLTKPAGCVPTIPILELTLRYAQKIVAISFHALTNCSFYIPFVLTFMHRMGVYPLTYFSTVNSRLPHGRIPCLT